MSKIQRTRTNKDCIVCVIKSRINQTSQNFNKTELCFKDFFQSFLPFLRALFSSWRAFGLIGVCSCGFCEVVEEEDGRFFVVFLFCEVWSLDCVVVVVFGVGMVRWAGFVL